MQSDIYLDAHRALDWLPVSLVRTLTRATWVARQLRRSEPYSSWGGRDVAAVEVTARRGCSVGLCAAELPRDVRVAQRARPSGRIHILVMVCSGRFELGYIQDRKSTSAMS
jgi:hypothetical protein